MGLPREVLFGKDTVTTGIFKEPVEGRVKLRMLNLDGDKQADLTVHGGEEKAVYAYPKEHYEYWQREFPNIALPWGMFGENLTTEGLSLISCIRKASSLCSTLRQPLTFIRQSTTRTHLYRSLSLSKSVFFACSDLVFLQNAFSTKVCVRYVFSSIIIR